MNCAEFVFWIFFSKLSGYMGNKLDIKCIDINGSRAGVLDTISDRHGAKCDGKITFINEQTKFPIPVQIGRHTKYLLVSVHLPSLQDA